MIQSIGRGQAKTGSILTRKEEELSRQVLKSNLEKLHITVGFMLLGLDQQSSAKSKVSLQFGHDQLV